ncbi:hypothetical protein ACFFHM_00400 [Halalkalibacter kiskunsagensis]|uniref:Uncharacterized protein n=1 Tax=Halalkalibacter kiskunsagensis TaxID=1548599 RepID=A0ABV6KAE0_9BACI
MKTKFISMILVVALIFSGFSTTAFTKDGNKTGEQLNQQLETVITNIEKNVNVKSDGISLNEINIRKSIKKEDIEAINQLAKEQGLDVVYTKKSFIDEITKGIKETNKQIQNGELKALSDGTLIENNDENFYLQGGSTYTTGYWWGKRHYRSTAAAAKWSYGGKQLALGHVVAGGAVAFFSMGTGFVIGAVASSYYFAFTNSIDYYNGLSNRGIIADVTWALVYSMRTQ